MTAPIAIPPTLNFLDNAYLAGWNTHPASGSLAAPIWDAASSGFRETILRDGGTARQAVELAGAVMEDCRKFRASLQDQGFQLPQPLPSRAAGWILDSFVDVSDQKGALLHFREAEQPKRLSLDLRDPKVATFEVTLQGGPTELIQKISIDREKYRITTDYYFLKTRMLDPAHAADLAAAIATKVYDSRQYNVEKELGSLKVRDAENEREYTFRRTQGRFTFRGKIPRLNEIQLVSAFSVFQETEGHREPVVTVSASDLTSKGPYMVSLLLYRPLNRPQRRMPLRAPLLNVLWQTIEKKVEGSPQGESHVGSPQKI